MEKLKLQSNNFHEKLSVLPVLGWTVEFSDDIGTNIAVDREKKRLVIKKRPEADPGRLWQTGVFGVAREAALEEFLRSQDPKEMVKYLSEDKQFMTELLRLTGARLLGEREAKIAQEISATLSLSDYVADEFKTACALYLATGNFPPASAAVAAELEKLPVSPKTDEHILSAFTNEGVAISRKKDYFERFIVPALERLRQADADLRAGESESFQPSTDDSPENQELDEREIKQRVLPFVGGYFREKAMDGVDWGTMRVIASGVMSEKLPIPEEERVIAPEAKIHTFFGINGQELSRGKITAALPASADVFAETLTSGLAIRRSANGTYALEWSGVGEPPAEYEFQFERKDYPRGWQKAEPTETEREIPSSVVETLSDDTLKFLEELRSARLTVAAKVRQVSRRTQKNIEYVNDTAVGQALSAAGAQYFSKLEEIKKGDCDVSNFYALVQIRALGIPCRLITGYHVSKDKRFPFAALAGQKHAWLEWWDGASGLWARIDATPSKTPEKKEDDQNEEKGGGEEKELKQSEEKEFVAIPEESDDDPFGLPFEDDDLEKLKELFSSFPETNTSDSSASRIFQDLYGISKEQWEEVRALCETVGRQKLPKQATIEKLSESSVAEEWKRIFDILLVAYRLPGRSRRIAGRQSQGGDLVDPVSAGIDVMVGSDDPYGFEKKVRREQIEKLPIRFSNDFLLDVTASMQAKNNQGESLLELERKFVLSSLFEGYKLNERVKQRAAELAATPLITSHVLSIHGGAKWSEIIKNSPVEVKELVMVNEVFQKPVKGAGAMAEAIEQYTATLEGDRETVVALKNGKMVKTLTILTDGNLWCSACGKESCSYELHGPSLARVNSALKRARELGVIINAIGFTEQSRPVAALFAAKEDPEAAVVVENLGEALAAHHRQAIRAMRPVAEAAGKRQLPV